ncbi:PAS domain-containing protein [Microvirga aerilata]|uniref:Blue-light-activated histidine kinase n=1 Tax=Microvirga aerilata TaxID=670292 RepID=A0A936Z6D4_9HYPH|nr:HWE histidine kinase domain-containing protein [Microvirga aerilata]MBL0404103.1 PAS domain-containing protein [Microvirga aerilata]
MSIRARLLWLVVALALPLTLVGSAGLYTAYSSEKQIVEVLLRDTARALALGADREVGKAGIILRVLSSSASLLEGDLARFHERAVEVTKGSSTWIGLFSPDGQSLLSTALPYGTPLPRSTRGETFQRIARTRQVELSGLIKGAFTGQPLLVIEHPVIQNGEVRYVMGLGMGTDALQALTRELQVPDSWIATMLDRDGKVVARSRDIERQIGQVVPRSLLDAMASQAEGALSLISLDNTPVISAFSRSPEYGIVAVVSYPQSAFAATMQRSLGWIITLIALSGGGILAAVVLARSIADPVVNLRKAAKELGSGRIPESRATGLVEVDQVQEALISAGVDRRQGEAQIRDSEMRLQLALEAGELGSWEYDPAGGSLIASASCRTNFGRGPEEPFSYEDLISSIHPEDREHRRQIVSQAIAEKTGFDVEYRVFWPDGSLHWIHVQGRPAERPDGIRLIGVSQDITIRKSAEAQQELLLHELNHRVKNTLATVQSIAAMTARSSADPASAWTTFDARIRGMAKTHDLLTETHWVGASLKDILSNELELYQDSMRQRISLRGSPVSLEPRATLALGLAVHELATNAAKYGALSVPQGRLMVKWVNVRIQGLPHLLIEWVETNGPVVSPPTRQGFGSRLIQRGLAQELGGEIKLNFEPAGLRCVITFPLHRIEETQPSVAAS